MPEKGVIKPQESPNFKREGAPTGGLVRAEIFTTPYPKVLWQENFSNCKVIPNTVKFSEGKENV